MVTSAIAEDDLAEAALVATEGFSDTLAIGRQNRQHPYRLDLPAKPAPQVPVERRFEVSERLDHEGREIRPLCMASVERVTQTGVQAVAVSLLHSYTDPVHEEALGHRLREWFSLVALPHQANPEAREYEPSATTLLSFGVMSLASGHLDQLARVKPEGARLHLFRSAGGKATPAVLRDLPLGLAISGPAAGVAAVGRIAGKLGIEQALNFEMGGHHRMSA